MLDSSTVTMTHPTCFQFKTSFSPCIIMQLNRFSLADLEHQVPATISRAPNFFMGSPIVIDLEHIDNSSSAVDFNALKKLLLTNNLVPIGIRGGTDAQHIAAVTAGIPIITVGKAKQAMPETEAQTVQKPVKSTPEIPTTQTKLITSPVRSGMQVYAKDADLIVIAPVSPGAELLADGNIHVYGPLRGRALAGVQGDTSARIFCSSLSAELVAIAGYYLVKEDLQALNQAGTSVQIFLENEDVKISTI